MNRRKFITQTAMAGPALALPAVEIFSNPQESSVRHASYELMVMATNWGFPGTISEFCEKAGKEGYHGIEIWMPGDQKSRDEAAAAAAKNGLAIAFLYGGSDKDPAIHFSQFREGINAAVSYKPVYINCHSGRDYFSMADNLPFMEFTGEMSAKTGIPFYHETHRGRSLFAAHVARGFMEKLPGLRLTFDVSHWCNVHESLLADQEETLALTLERVDHIHVRVGHPEGPQVNDPRAPEWENAVKTHFNWWDKVVARKKKEGKRMTILTEFGPPDYMPTLPYTRQPLASQWEINVYMLNLLKKRYG